MSIMNNCVNINELVFEPVIQLSSLTELRLSCCNNPMVADLLITSNYLVKCFEFCKQFAISATFHILTDSTHSIDSPNSYDISTEKKKLISICKLLSNFSSSGSKYCDYLLTIDQQQESGKKVELSDVLASITIMKSKKVLGIFIGMVCNCIHSKVKDCRLLTTDRSFICQLMLAILPSIQQVSNTSTHPNNIQNEEEEAALIDWLKIFGYHVMRSHCTAPVYNLMQSRTPSETAWTVKITHEQIIYLQLLIITLEDSEISAKLFESDANQDLMHSFYALIEVIITQLALIPVDSLLSAQSIDRIEGQLLLAFLPTGLQLIGEGLSASIEYQPDSLNQWKDKDPPSHRQLIQWCSDFLKDRQYSMRQKRPIHDSCLEIDEIERTVIRLSLQVLANLIHGNQQHKHYFRECSGLVNVLSHCVTDFTNPMSREWALFCIRNSCEDCVENQDYIEALQPQQIENEELKNQGIHIETNPTTGKFKFVKKDK